jgi:lactoylglutathione lyase
MLGLWESANSPNRMQLHIAFDVSLGDILKASDALRTAGITPLDFNGDPTAEPQVLAWMPAASIYFRDPDGHLLEFLAMLDQAPTPDRGVVPWAEWTKQL